jgi:hypothetical protein
MKTATPFALWTSAFAAARMMTEAQFVIALRLAGMAGLWTLAPGETARMVTEKQRAFAESAVALTAAAAGGRRPEQILDAAVRPLGRRTRANSRRLGQAVIRGPRRKR